MSLMHYLRTFVILAPAAAVAVQVCAQTEHPQTWAQDIAILSQMTPTEATAHQARIAQIRREVAYWLANHPNTAIQLPPAPAEPMTTGQATAELSALRTAVEAIVAADPAHPFHLGMTEVEVSADLSPLSPTAESITQSEIRAHQASNVAKAIDLLPGVEISRIAGNRNEAAFMIRGFSSNGQVPIYMDGIPIYVPYDGYIDLNRFVTSDIAEIQVARGFSSPLLGPDALGGSVNLVSREPSRPFEGDAAMGTYSGNGLLSSLRIGSRRPQLLAQGTLDWLQNDYIPLSGSFAYPAGGYAALTPGNAANTVGNVPYALTDHENQSDSRDEKWTGRLGWLHHGDAYVFSYINQKGQKGVPLYQGPNANAAFRNFWKWPYWNKTSYYFLSNTGLGEKSSIKFRVYYDQFRDSINMYDNSLYNSMNSYTVKSGSGSEMSRYDDHTDGASTEFHTALIPHNRIGASGFFKDDTHKETGVYPGAAKYSTAAEFIPVKELRDQQSSIGVEDVITFGRRLFATVGFSADHMKGLTAETYNSYNHPTTGTYANTLILPYQCKADPSNDSYSGCTAHFWNYNPQASATYTISASDVVFVTVEDRGRFPTLKQRYSSGMGSALPNPDLTTEHSLNWNFGYNRTFGAHVTAEVQLFRMNLRDAIESALVPDPQYDPTTDPKDLLGLCPSNSSIGHCSQNINIGKETHEGVEFDVLATPISRLTLKANYTYLDRTIGHGTLPDGTTLSSALVLPAGIPKNKAIGTATVRLPLQILGMVTGRYEGGIPLQDTTYSPTHYYAQALATADLGVMVPVRSKFEAQAGLRNLFDRNYSYTAGYPEEGRNWFLNLRYHF